jgi:hypothetical protein
MDKHFGNPHDLGIINVTSSSVKPFPTWESFSPKFCLSRDDRFHFESAFGEVEWICWDFKRLRIDLTGYRIKGTLDESWSLQGSVDNINWTVFDRESVTFSREDVTSFVLPPYRARVKFRYILLWQRATSNKPKPIILYQIEFFGTLFE